MVQTRMPEVWRGRVYSPVATPAARRRWNSGEHGADLERPDVNTPGNLEERPVAFNRGDAQEVAINPLLGNTRRLPWKFSLRLEDREGSDLVTMRLSTWSGKRASLPSPITCRRVVENDVQKSVLRAGAFQELVDGERLARGQHAIAEGQSSKRRTSRCCGRCLWSLCCRRATGAPRCALKKV